MHVGLDIMILVLNLMPTKQMINATLINQVKAEALGVSPLAPPRRPLGSLAPLPRSAFPGALRACWDISPVDPQHHHRTAPPSRCHLGDATFDLITRRPPLQHGEPLSHLIGQRV